MLADVGFDGAVLQDVRAGGVVVRVRSGSRATPRRPRRRRRALAAGGVAHRQRGLEVLGGHRLGLPRTTVSFGTPWPRSAHHWCMFSWAKVLMLILRAADGAADEHDLGLHPPGEGAKAAPPTMPLTLNKGGWSTPGSGRSTPAGPVRRPC